MSLAGSSHDVVTVKYVSSVRAASRTDCEDAHVEGPPDRSVNSSSAGARSHPEDTSVRPRK